MLLLNVKWNTADNFVLKTSVSFCFSVYNKQKGQLYLTLICQLLRKVTEIMDSVCKVWTGTFGTEKNLDEGS